MTLYRRGLRGHIRSGKDGSAEMVGVPVHLARHMFLILVGLEGRGLLLSTSRRKVPGLSLTAYKMRILGCQSSGV